MNERGHFAVIGALLNLPQATKVAIKAKKILKPITEASPLEIWKTQAHIINTMSAKATNGVNLGWMRSTEGNINPIPPNKSIIAVNFSRETEICAVQGHMADNFSMGRNSLTNPAQTKRSAINICAIQRAKFNFFI